MFGASINRSLEDYHLLERNVDYFVENNNNKSIVSTQFSRDQSYLLKTEDVVEVNVDTLKSLSNSFRKELFQFANDKKNAELFVHAHVMIDSINVHNSSRKCPPLESINNSAKLLHG